MAFQLEGTYVENCNCEVICPCSWSSLLRPASHDRCKVVLVMPVDRGDIMSPGLGAVELHNVAHPVNTNLTVGEGVGSRISLLGIEYSGDGTAGFSAPFSWAA
jgi:hypothetical protein